MPRVDPSKKEIWCRDCLELGNYVKADMYVNMRGWVENPLDTQKLLFGELANYPIAELCGECKRRRRRREGEEWMSMPDARRTLAKRAEREGLVSGSFERKKVVARPEVLPEIPVGNLFQQRAAGIYSKK